jgi:hypothetical protein
LRALGDQGDGLEQGKKEKGKKRKELIIKGTRGMAWNRGKKEKKKKKEKN